MFGKGVKSVCKLPAARPPPKRGKRGCQRRPLLEFFVRIGKPGLPVGVTGRLGRRRFESDQIFGRGSNHEISPLNQDESRSGAETAGQELVLACSPNWSLSKPGRCWENERKPDRMGIHPPKEVTRLPDSGSGGLSCRQSCRVTVTRVQRIWFSWWLKNQRSEAEPCLNFEK